MPDSPEHGLRFFEWLSGVGLAIASGALAFVTRTQVKLARLEDKADDIEKELMSHKTSSNDKWNRYYGERDAFVHAAHKAEQNGEAIKDLQKKIDTKLEELLAEVRRLKQ